MNRILLALVAILACAPLAGAQEREPQPDAMVHMDLSHDPPRYIPDELTLLPGATVQFMLFGKGASHSVTLDAGADATVPSGEADGFYERAAELKAPLAPGDYAFHDKASGARGVMKIRVAASEPAVIGVRENGYDLHFSPERIEVAPGASITFRANGSFAHTLTSDTGAWNDSTLALAPGQSATFTAPTTPGEYAFHCRYHKEGGMVGVLVVKAASDSVTPSPAAKSTPGVALVIVAFAIALAAFARRGRR